MCLNDKYWVLSKRCTILCVVSRQFNIVIEVIGVVNCNFTGMSYEKYNIFFFFQSDSQLFPSRHMQKESVAHEAHSPVQCVRASEIERQKACDKITSSDNDCYLMRF